MCLDCSSSAQKFYEHQEICQEIQTKISNYNLDIGQNQCEEVLIKTEANNDSSFNEVNTEAWAITIEEPLQLSSQSERKFQCDQCGFNLKDRTSFLEHMKSHAVSEKRFNCETCSRRFKTAAHLEFHLHTDHEKQTGSFQCPRCLKKGISNFREHFMKEHKEARYHILHQVTNKSKDPLKLID